MLENKNEVIIPGTSSKSIKMDLIRFKDDILKDMRIIQISLNDKYSKVEDYLKGRINKFELKIGVFENKIAEYSNLINIDNSLKENIESLIQFKEEIRDTLFKRRAKYIDFEKKMNDEIDRINKVLMDTVIYPGIIGNSAKFKTYHDFIDYVLTEISQLILFKEKSGLDIAPFKRKIEQSIDAFKIQMNNFSTKEFTNNLINQSEEKINSLLKLNDERLKSIKYENTNLNKKLDETNKKIEILFKFKNKVENNDNLYGNFNNEIIIIKKEINNINEILKKLISFQSNFEKVEKKSSKIISGVKQYINGQLNANELSTMKKFTYDKSKGKKIEKYSPSSNTSEFPSSEKLKHSFEFSKRKSFVPNIPYLFMNRNNNLIIDNNNENVFFFQKNLNNSDSLKIKEGEKENKKEINNIKSYKYNKRNSYTFDPNFLSFKLTTKLKNNLNFCEKESNSIESQNKVSKYNNNNKNQNDSLSKINEEKNKNNLNNNNLNNNKNSSNIKENENQYIIKEEDENENILSEHSTKNLNQFNLYKNFGDKNIKMNNKLFKGKLNKNKNDKDNSNYSSINNKDTSNDNFGNNKNEKSTIENILNKKIQEVKCNIENNNNKIINNNNMNENDNIDSDKNNNNLKNKIENNINKNIITNTNKTSKIVNFQKQNMLYNNDKNKNKIYFMKKLKENNQSVPLFDSYYIELSENKEVSGIVPSDNLIKNNNGSFTGGLPLRNIYNHANNLSEEKNYKFNDNNFKGINNISNNTAISFPSINKNILINKKTNPIKNITFQNNLFDFMNMNGIGDSFNSNNDNMKVISYIKKPKKVLLTSPDNIPPNSIIKRKVFKNKSYGYKSEKNRNKQIEKMFENFNTKNKNKIKNFNNIQSIASSIHKLISNH